MDKSIAVNLLAIVNVNLKPEINFCMTVLLKMNVKWHQIYSNRITKTK